MPRSRESREITRGQGRFPFHRTACQYESLLWLTPFLLYYLETDQEIELKTAQSVKELP